ncbi:hypothetical protein [Pseudoalteromonas sp. A601]|nr:hypothetical protein [Pseudoalteromonas sp. A601]
MSLNEVSTNDGSDHYHIVPLMNIFAHANTLQDYAASGEELNPKKIKQT